MNMSKHKLARSVLVAALAVLLALCFTLPSAFADDDTTGGTGTPVNAGDTVNASLNQTYTVTTVDKEDDESVVNIFKVTPTQTGRLTITTNNLWSGECYLRTASGSTLANAANYWGGDYKIQNFYNVKAGTTYDVVFQGLYSADGGWCDITFSNDRVEHMTSAGGTIKASFDTDYYVQNNRYLNENTKIFKIKTKHTGLITVNTKTPYSSTSFYVCSSKGERLTDFDINAEKDDQGSFGVSAGKTYKIVVSSDSDWYSIKFANTSYRNTVGNASKQKKAKTIKLNKTYTEVVPVGTQPERWMKVRLKTGALRVYCNDIGTDTYELGFICSARQGGYKVGKDENGNEYRLYVFCIMKIQKVAKQKCR